MRSWRATSRRGRVDAAVFRPADARLDDVGQPDVDSADRYHVAVAGAVELVVGLGFRRRLGYADPLVAFLHSEAHGQLPYAGVGAQLADADEKLRDEVVHGARYARHWPAPDTICSALLALDGRTPGARPGVIGAAAPGRSRPDESHAV